MKAYINEEFLLGNNKSRRLYFDYCIGQPIIDFHCHLSPREIAEDRMFNNLTEAWLEGDHYKWRAMRWNGIPERFCTGNADPKDKFARWAETVPFTIGNPLYHWTHLELARYFGIYKLLSPATARRIYNEASTMLRSDEFSTRSLITKMNVRLLCTTDDPADSLEHHRSLKDTFRIPVLPAFRTDSLVRIEDPEVFRSYLERLEIASGITITSFDSFLEVIDKRHEWFHENGCRLSDTGTERFYFEPYTAEECKHILLKLQNLETLSPTESEKFKCAVLLEVARMNHKRGWVQQFHTGAIRNNNSRMFRLSGPDTGWDSVGSPADLRRMSRFLDALDESDQLAKTILYNLNPADNEAVITMAGNFNDGSVPARVQYGAAWWFLDQKNGIERHLKDLASLGLLRRFAGMVTDSRSFLSYPRHEYFRRLLCNFIGEEIEKGIIPGDEDLIRPLIEGIIYRNAIEYFGFADHL
jgi:glucuronate isomerase